MKQKTKVTRKKCREHLGQFNLACELSKIIKHFFPDLVNLLKKLPDPRNQSYTTYPAVLLLMTRILSSVFYISSMRKTSEEFNSDVIIENIWEICGGKPSVDEIPYWETINRYLKKTDPARLQDVVNQLVRRLLRGRAFENARFRGKYWQVIIDGTQLYSSRKTLGEKSLYRIHNKGTDNEYRENYYYVLEAKIVCGPDIVISIMTGFVENDGNEAEKQDCERKACWRLMEKLKKAFPHLNICLCADSLYACERFFKECRERGWHYILRFKEGGIPYVAEEYRQLRKTGKNYMEKGACWYDYVTDIDYNGYKINLAEYGEKKPREENGVENQYWFITDLPVNKRNVGILVQRGRMRWLIENEGFKTQKKHGYYIGHMFSKDYQAMKNHYFLIQIGHMVSQVLESWKKIWKNVKQSIEQKHRRIFESFKTTRLAGYREEFEKRFHVRFT